MKDTRIDLTPLQFQILIQSQQDIDQITNDLKQAQQKQEIIVTMLKDFHNLGNIPIRIDPATKQIVIEHPNE